MNVKSGLIVPSYLTTTILFLMSYPEVLISLINICRRDLDFNFVIFLMLLKQYLF
jgi:hypothetical protein